MAVRILPLLFFLSLSPSRMSAGPPASQAPPQEVVDQTELKPDSRLIREAFQGQFTKEQLARFKGQPTLGNLIERMSPDQRHGARERLGELRLSAKTPEELEQVANGYLMLDENEPNAGQNAVQVAEKMMRMEPESSAGFAIAASGYHQMGDYPAAAEWARGALKRSPDDETAKGVLMLSVGRVKRSGTVVAATAPRPSSNFSVGEWSIPEKDVSPQALSLMLQAVAARKAGDMERTMALTQAAMNADPTSPGVQHFYNVVEAGNKKHVDTTEFLLLSKEALKAGQGADAVAWAQKAAERSKDPTVLKILELTIQRSEKMALAPAKDLESKKKAPTNDGLPLWPIGAGLGLTAVGFGIYRGRQAWSEQDFEKAEAEDPNSERIQRNRHRAKGVALAVGVFVAVRYGGPLIVAAGSAATGLWRAASTSFQRVVTSNVGALNPGEAQALTSAARAGSTRLVPGFNAVESQVISEAQQILVSPQFAELQEAFKAGRPVVVTIGGRLIQYEPGLPAAGFTNFQNNGFAIGREAFKSSVELQKTVLHELHRLATSQWANGVTGPMATQETNAAQAFAEKAIGALPK